MAREASDSRRKVVARNRKARHEFQILETFEAGIELKGPEVKSLRAGNVSFQDAHARVQRGELWLHSVHISPYEQANRSNVDPVRARRLLLHRHEIRRLVGKIKEKGLTIVPLEIYFARGYAKVNLALARGKKLYDKREDLKRSQQDLEARRAIQSR
ncbi:MAG: SsrA-binding protein SmpB [Gemmatimonadetes bacterium]|jgi:SsrA-binding protein|nr:SsrA-binding protein SmpB [Gemmatimonadota bacterium]MEE2847248.1 SsrA-binding protein SmpB [Gemmatimonadota bacterium]HAC05686.1 SsrA-binding protein [Gemmatimonadota bacterium]HBD97802.1 SsrA-binding protein [Gemmatimonadota bacterium]HIC52780.1 SsrA-binding protein SmpB [Gemmatimonadota bacterium]|tara:strand:- start:590 stop:1060 length:471 start_codon:yes stop_codon:yes gene_type:complete